MPDQLEVKGYEGGSKKEIGKVDVNWWIEQVRQGIVYRQDQTMENKWSLWTNFYANKFPGSELLPINLFFMMVRTLIPRLYFRNPSMSLIPSKPGPEQMGVAALLERIDNKMIRSMGMKQQLKAMAQETFFYGTSFGKLGYGAEFMPPIGEVAVEDSKLPWASTDYRMNIVKDRPWFLRAPLGKMVLPSGTVERSSAPWEAQIMERNVDDFRRDSRFKGTSDVEPTKSSNNPEDKPDTVELFEIHDKRTRHWFVIAPDAPDGKRLVLGPLPDGSQTPRGGPFYPLIFNPQLTTVYGLSDSQVLEPYQREINKTAASVATHARITTRKFKVRTGGMEEQELNEMVNGPPGAAFFVEDMGDLDVMNTGGIPPELVQFLETILDIVKMTVGFSRNQFGEYRSGSESASATEANIVRQASEIRVDERRDVLADLLVNVVMDMNRLIASKWSGEMVERVSGPYGVPIWVKFSGDILKHAEYEVKADPDSSVPETKAAREQRAVQTFQLLSPLAFQPDPQTGRPLIDSVRLTRYLLSELNGTQYDDMIMGVPNIYGDQFVQTLQQGNAGVNEPIGVEQFGQMLQQAPAASAELQRIAGG